MRLSTAFVFATLLCAPAFAAITHLARFDFDTEGTPWASSGPVSFDTFTGTPVQADGAAFIDSDTYAHGTNFVGELTTGYGIKLWLKAPAIIGDGAEVLIASLGNPESDGIGIYYVQSETNAYITVRANGSGGGGVFAPEGGFDNWTHVTLCYTNRMDVYIDGELQGWSSAPVNSPTSDWYLFSTGETAPKFTGYVDDVTFFSFEEGCFEPEVDMGFFEAVVPEPSTGALLAGLAAMSMIGIRRRR